MVLSSLRENLLQLEEIVLKSAFPAPFHVIYHFNNFLYARLKKIQKSVSGRWTLKNICIYYTYSFILDVIQFSSSKA